jgi:hypothetical protein
MAKKTLAEKMAENSKAVYAGMKTNTIGSFSSMENIKQNLVILDELKNLIPPLLESEFLALKDNLQKHGCKDPLKVWQTTNQVISREGALDVPVYVLIDGHNRFQLCSELQIPFNIQIDNFESLKDVRDFMIDFQLSRRNITPQQASYLRGLKYNTEKREVVDNLTNLPSDTNLPNGHYDHLANLEKKTTAQELGKYFNVGEKTIRRDAEFARGLEKLEIGFRQDILKGLIKVEKIKLQKISQAATIIEPIKSIEELNFVYNTLIIEEPISNASLILNLKEQKYSDLNFQLQRIYTSTTHTNSDIKALKTIFKEFIETL